MPANLENHVMAKKLIRTESDLLTALEKWKAAGLARWRLRERIAPGSPAEELFRKIEADSEAREWAERMKRHQEYFTTLAVKREKADRTGGQRGRQNGHLQKKLPQNPVVLRLVRELQKPANLDRAKTEVAREFCRENNIKGIKPDSLLRKIRDL